jgi:hypothetical protein
MSPTEAAFPMRNGASENDGSHIFNALLQCKNPPRISADGF